jgi:dihydrodipicolinate synthase/N-acetylneuraminate lyase
LVERLVKRFSNIAGIAYGGSDITYLAELIERVGDRIEVHCAGPGNALAVLGLGGNGFMGGEGNLSPEIAAAVISGFRERDMERVRDAWSKLLKVAAIADRYGGNASSMRAMKPLLNAFGLPGGTLRSPRIAISGRDLEDAINAIVQLKLPGLPAAPVAQGVR